MDKNKISLPGLILPDRNKWYCNYYDKTEARCSDIFTENGSHIQHVKLYTLTGNEAWKYDSNSRCYYFNAYDKFYDECDGGKFDPMLCTHFRWTPNAESTPLYMFSGGSTNEIKFNYDNGIGGINNFVSWLKKELHSAVPVQVEYILKHPIYYAPFSHERTSKLIMDRLISSTH